MILRDWKGVRDDSLGVFNPGIRWGLRLLLWTEIPATKALGEGGSCLERFKN